ncbi:MAG TPA: hypothetical protein VEX35_04470 [Allosphingosinicella sp.]|nr:hypothetical protein [Allosphingosinicella sp.]
MTIKPPVEPAPIDGDAFGEAHRQLVADNTIQFDLPPVQEPNIPDMSGAIPFIQVLFWVAVAGFALFILYLIANRLAGADWSRRSRGGDEAEAESWRPQAREARELLGDADALAAQGLYSEAARLLLFRSIEDIDAKRPDLIRRAFTSRDIAALEEIPPPPRSAFLAIAMMVERSLFAERPLAAGDWASCRSAYESFAFAEGWRG